jgi:hypothetical protein
MKSIHTDAPYTHAEAAAAGGMAMSDKTSVKKGKQFYSLVPGAGAGETGVVGAVASGVGGAASAAGAGAEAGAVGGAGVLDVGFEAVAASGNGGRKGEAGAGAGGEVPVGEADMALV